MAQFFGGTSMLITVGVMLDTMRQMESHLMMRHYDGFLKGGRGERRRTAAAGQALMIGDSADWSGALPLTG